MVVEDFLFHLQEARIHLEEIENSKESFTGEDAVDLLVRMGHVQEHLNLAWASIVGGDEDEAKRIPNWTCDFELFSPKY